MGPGGGGGTAVSSGHPSPAEPGRLIRWQRHLPAGSRLSAAEVTAPGTLLRSWVAGWTERPHARVFWDGLPDRREGSSGGEWWSAAEFEAATRAAAGRLTAAGLEPGDRVLWSTRSSVLSLVAHVGALRAGLVVVPANTAYTRSELAHIVGDVRPAAAIVDDPDRRRWLSETPGRPMVVTGPGLDLADGICADLDRADPDDPALICFTSGTTGMPKGAVLRHRNLLAATRSVVLAWQWGPDDRLVHCLPIFHAHGLCVGAYGTLLAGSSAVLLPSFDPEAVLDAADQHRASLFFGVPTMYHRLATSSRVAELGRLRLCVSGSAPLAAELHRQVSAAIGTPVLERYGMTETLMNASNPYDGERRAGTVGFPLPGVELVLADDDEILLRGPNVFDGYWERPEATAESFVAATDGGRPWFRTGDLGTVDHGYLSIRGRSKELVISGGFNVYPAEVEDVLVAHPNVAEVAVTGTPSEEWGEVVTAWVVADGPPPTADALAAWSADRLAPFKRPRIVHVLDELPRNALGKVVRGMLG
jgi:malonyl-CoA/methylmalonyl-CoA synthetase